MRRFVRLCPLPVLLCGCVLLPAFAAEQTPAFKPVRAWQDTISLPTYDEGPPAEDPPFDVLRPGKPVYPYTMRLEFGSAAKAQTWRIIHLENEFLACSVLPDLGGHLYRCIDKANGHDVFHPALSIKKQDIALRGSWITTGIEFNFPVGHSWVTVSPVDFSWRQNDDGSASVFVGNVDRVEGMQWLVELILRPRSRVLEQRVTLYNPSEFRQRYYWWANAAITVESPDMTFVYPTHLMHPEGHPEITVPWPRSREGVDLSRQGNSKDMLGLFTVGSKEPFMAVYNPASKTGLAHYADPVTVPGKKVWSWGTDKETWVRKNLTDNDTTYVELQAGVLGTQSDFDFLEPQQVKRFTEYWIPVHDMDGITRATPDAVLNLQRENQNVLVQIEANRNIGHAHVRLTSGAKTLLDETVDLTMLAVYSKHVPVADGNPLSFELLDAHGKPLLRHTEGVYDALSPEQAAAAQAPRGVAKGCDTKDGCFAEAVHYERIGNLAAARNSYESALIGFRNPPLSAKGLARLEIMQAHFASAISRYERIPVGGAALDPESEYYWGVAMHHIGNPDSARRHWTNAIKDPSFAAPAKLEIARDEAAAGHWNQALADVAPLGELSKLLPSAGELEVIALRHLGQKAKVAEHLQAWLALDPTNAVLRNEATLLGKDDPSLWLHLAAEPERVLNVVDTYLRVADYPAALALLERTYPQVPANQMEPGAVSPQQYPLIAYYRGYCRQMLGTSAAGDYAAASRLPVRYVFPSRLSSLEVLNAAIFANPADGAAHYLRGTLEMQFAMPIPSLQDLRAAVRANFREPVVFWNLAVILDLLRAPGEAQAALGKARDLQPLPAGMQLLEGKLSARLSPPTAHGKHHPKPKLEVSAAPAAPAPKPVASATLAVTASHPAPSAAPVLPAAKPAPEPKPAVDSTALTSDELARFVLDQLARSEVNVALDALKQERLKQVSSNGLLRQAYYEAKLQNALFVARKRQCDDIASMVQAATQADSERPFTRPGGEAVLESPRFLFYLGRSFGLCGDVKQAQALWKQAAGKQRDITSPEYAFPVLSRVQLNALNGKPVRPELEKALAPVDQKLKSASKDQLPALSYSAAMLLQALGRLDEANMLFRAAMQGDPLLEYGARVGIRDSDLARHGVK